MPEKKVTPKAATSKSESSEKKDAATRVTKHARLRKVSMKKVSGR